MAYRLSHESASRSTSRPEMPLAPALSRRRRAARRTLAVLPSLCTLGNLLCGFAAIFIASRPVATKLPFEWTPFTFAAGFIFLGMLFDALDGRLARLTRNVSDLGEQLDSMADMVTFGVAPAFLAVQLVGVQTPFLSSMEMADRYFDRIALVLAGIYVACTALRLARFNAELDQPEESDHTSFKGLPSPAAAGTVASLVLLHQHFLAAYTRAAVQQPDLPTPRSLSYSAGGMIAIMALSAIAMVSHLRYVHVVNRYVRGRKPLESLAKGIIILLLLAIWPQQSLAAVFVVYALSAPLVWLWRRATARAAAPMPQTTAAPATPAPSDDRSATSGQG